MSPFSSPSNLISFPPTPIPIPAKPIFFDIAFGFLSYPREQILAISGVGESLSEASSIPSPSFFSSKRKDCPEDSSRKESTEAGSFEEEYMEENLQQGESIGKESTEEVIVEEKEEEEGDEMAEAMESPKGVTMASKGWFAGLFS